MGLRLDNYLVRLNLHVHHNVDIVIMFGYKNIILFNIFLDLKHILDEEKNNSETEGWRLVKNTDLAEVWKKSEDDTPVNLIKVHVFCYD